ncbi:MAG: deoxyhypusine synthase family protein, partial [Candidatus Norongarragalinales archaeon]
GVVVGGGIAKHHLIGAAILRNGLDYAVYVGTGTQYDGSLSGARPTEAVSWNKLKNKRNSAFVEGEATLVLPVLATAFL